MGFDALAALFTDAGGAAAGDAAVTAGTDAALAGATDAAVAAGTDAAATGAVDAGIGAGAGLGTGTLGTVGAGVDLAAPALTADEMATGAGAADALTAGAGATGAADLGAAANSAMASGSDIAGGAGASGAIPSSMDAMGNSYITGGPESMGGTPAPLDATPTSSPYDPSAPDPNAPPIDTTSDPYANETNKFLDQGSGPTSVQTGVTPETNSSISNALKQLGVTGDNAFKYGLPAASLGMNAVAQHKATSAADQLKQIAQPASSTSNNLLSKFNSGQISAADSYAINQQMQNSIAQAKQYYASAGLSNSSMEHEAIQNIQNNAENQRQQALQNMLTQGLSAAGTAQGPQLAAIQAGVQSDAQLQQATANFMSALARMNAGSTAPAASQTPTGT
jgi:hypothetical protein